jgi:signal transduction histidine kinase
MGDGTGSMRRAAVWGTLAASLAGALLFVVARVGLPSDGARVAFYDEAWSAEGVAIAPIDEAAGGLAPGDIVTTVDGRSLESWLTHAANPGIGRPGGDQPIAYGLVRDGAAVTTSLTWERPSVGATLLGGWSVIVLSIAFAGIAAFVFARRPNEPSAIPLILAAAAIAGSSLPWFMGATVSDIVEGGPFLLHALLTGPLYMLLWPAAVHLALVFPAPLPLVRRWTWLVPAVYAVGLGGYGLALLALRLVTPSALDWVGTWPTVQVALIVPLLLLAAGLLVRSYLRTTDPLGRTRIRWATLGAVASAALGLVLFWLPQLVLRQPLVDVSWIGIAALPLPLGLAAGILRNRLFDIDVAVNRTLVYGGLTLGVITTYTIAAAAMGTLVGPEHGYGVSLLATGIAALVALPIRDALQRTVNRLMYGERDEPWRAIRRLGQRLEWTAEPGRAFPAIAETVAGALRLPYVALELTDDGGGRTLAAEHGTRREPAVTLPVVHGGEPVGRLILGLRAGEQGFRPDELGLLEDLARQAGAAIQAMRLQAELVRSREALVLAREEERRRLRRDLHDGLGPSLAAIGLRADASAATLERDPAGATRLLEELGADVDIALADIRRLVDGLRPPALDELGLLGAIDQQMTRLQAGGAGSAGAVLWVEGDPTPLPELPAAVEVAAYRIAVEAVTNAVRHAEASECRVRVHADDALTVEITDDGRGLPATVTPGVGLESIRARAEELGGSWRLERPAGGGTRIVARLPLAGGGSVPGAEPGPAAEPA